MSQANDSRDALIKDLYACLFRAIIDYINESIQGESTLEIINNTTGATCGAGTTYLSGYYSGVRVARSFVL
jgi:hypothetical protein